MFSVDDRARLRDALVARASDDARVVAAALVGSMATDTADRWSDIDLALGIDDDVDPFDVLGDWSAWLAGTVHATTVLDWPVGPAVYRIFLLPDCLQVDLSVVAASAFTQRSPRFRLLFGEHLSAIAPPPSRDDVFGYAVVYATEARRDVERGRAWQAQHFVAQVRDHAMTLACLNRGLPHRNGQGYDRLPPSLLDAFAATLVASVTEAEVRDALATVVRLLLAEAEGLAAATALREPLERIADGELA